MSTTKKTTARGLGWHHQQTRRRLLANHADGTPCWWCGKPMYREPAQNWDGAALEADHALARSHGGRTADRMLHMTCNRQRGDGSRDNTRPALGHAPEPTEAPTGTLGTRVMPWPW